MDSLERLKSLSSQMYLEPAEDTGCPKVDSRASPVGSLYNAALPNGRRTALLKTLLTSACERNCFYCPFRAGRNYRRATLKPEEMAHTFTNLHRAGIAGGLFLSSGVIGGGVRTQDKIIATAEILRQKLNYRGYLHLKLMPGVERAQVERTMQLADRVSVNLEAPNTSRLEKLAPRKDFFDELLQPLRWVDEIRSTQNPQQAWNGLWPSSVTQFVVGAVGENDLELLSTSEHLYHTLHLRRAYYSAFSPIADTPLENLPPTPKEREFHLYQASFLIRDYGFNVEELPFDHEGNLPLHIDPKLAWAKVNLAGKPLEVNKATHSELLRIPGIGPRSARTIVAARKIHPLRLTEDLQRLGINSERAREFILLDGRKPSRQLSFW